MRKNTLVLAIVCHGVTGTSCLSGQNETGDGSCQAASEWVAACVPEQEPAANPPCDEAAAALSERILAMDCEQVSELLTEGKEDWGLCWPPWDCEPIPPLVEPESVAGLRGTYETINAPWASMTSMSLSHPVDGSGSLSSGGGWGRHERTISSVGVVEGEYHAVGLNPMVGFAYIRFDSETLGAEEDSDRYLIVGLFRDVDGIVTHVELQSLPLLTFVMARVSDAAPEPLIEAP